MSSLEYRQPSWPPSQSTVGSLTGLTQLNVIRCDSSGLVRKCSRISTRYLANCPSYPGLRLVVALLADSGAPGCVAARVAARDSYELVRPFTVIRRGGLLTNATKIGTPIALASANTFRSLACRVQSYS